MTDHLTDLKNLKYSTENEKGRAESKIFELSEEIQKIEKGLRFYPVERSVV